MKLATWACLLAATLAACSFPEIEFTGTSSSSGSGGAGQGGASTSSTSSTSTSSSTSTTTSTTTTSTASGGVCSNGCPETGCGSHDKDCDGHGDVNCGAGGGGGASPYDDCNDCDPDAHPGQTMFFATPTAVKMDYDYDCDGAQTHQYESIDCGGLNCGQMNVFLTGSPVMCGVTASFGNCKLKGVPVPTCQDDQPQDKPQGCR